MDNWIPAAAAICLVSLGLAACGMPAMTNQAKTASSTTLPAASPAASPQVTPVSGNAAVLTPCRKDFMTRDTDSDGFITLAEWLESEKGKVFIQAPEAAFKQKDANGDGQLDLVEFGCETPTPGATPNGRA